MSYQPQADAADRIRAGGREAVLEIVREEAAALVGTEILVHTASGIHDPSSSTAELNFNPPARVRILEPIAADLDRWNDEDVCDPVYPVELLSEHDQMPADTRILFVYGRSWHLNGSSDAPDYVTDEPSAAPAMR